MNDLLSRPLRGPAIYNPDLLSKDELIRGFVARQDLLRFFLDELGRVATGGGVQHHLLLGQRGMGKTTLLRRLRHAIDDDPALREAWLPLTFPEEQYDVAHLSDFYLNCIDALSDALESRGKSEAARALDTAVAAIPRDPESARADRALELLLRTATRQKARLLLLLDNIDLLLYRLSDDQWTLRELLSSQERICIVGASAASIETTYDYGKPFYDFFRVHPLGGLDDAECREVLLALSRMFGTPQVEEWVDKEPGRLRALRLLTGGNPRMVALLHTVAASSAGGDVRSDLERLLDQCTALYKHRFESLPDQAQRVVHALALHWQPASAAEIAEATRLEINAVSSQLARLVLDGVVEKVPFFPETKTGFQIAERFFNIWYLMRSSRRVRRRLVWLVEFLKMFYEGDLHSCEEVGDEAEHGARKATHLIPDDLQAVHTAATILARRGHWAEAHELARRFLMNGSSDWHAEIWEDIVLFFREAVAAGHAADAGALLDETELGERWLPLREALRILAADNPLLLRKLAPEVQEPVRLLMARLAPSAATPPRPNIERSARPPSGKRASTARKAGSTPRPRSRAAPPREGKPGRNPKSP